MRLISKEPAAVARLKGGTSNPGISGTVRFYQFPCGVVVEADVTGLPKNCSGFFGFHIHTGSSCAGGDFSKTGDHFNPGMKQHPRHAGDLPPLLSYNGRAYIAVMTDRFSIGDVVGRTVVIHSEADDFQSQPSGRAGDKIACGAVEKIIRRR